MQVSLFIKTAPYPSGGLPLSLTFLDPVYRGQQVNQQDLFPIFGGPFAFFLTDFRNSLQILDTTLLLNTFIGNIFSHLVASLFILLIAAVKEQEFFLFCFQFLYPKFIHSFHKYLLDILFMSSGLLGFEGTVVNRIQFLV